MGEDGKAGTAQDEETVLVIHVGIDDADAEEIATLTSQLQQELLQLDVYAVEQSAAGSAPPGSKGVSTPATGTLLIRLLESSPVLGTVIRTLRSWLSRRPGRSIELTIDGDTVKVTNVTIEDQRRLIDAWLARHSEK